MKQQKTLKTQLIIKFLNRIRIYRENVQENGVMNLLKNRLKRTKILIILQDLSGYNN